MDAKIERTEKNRKTEYILKKANKTFEARNFFQGMKQRFL